MDARETALLLVAWRSCSPHRPPPGGAVPLPSLEWDEEVRAVVSLRPGSRVTPGELRGHVPRHLAGYTVPKVVYVVDHLPVNPSGKVAQADVRAMLGW